MQLNIIFISGTDKDSIWKRCLEDELPGAHVYVYPDCPLAKKDIDYAVVWNPPAGELATYPGLKAILSLGAGIDGIVSDPGLPKDVPIIRLVDRCLTQGMTEYVLYWVLHFHRRMGEYAEMMAARRWDDFFQADTAKTKVGVLGLGELGSDAAKALSALNFQVAGWSRSAKSIDGVTCLHDAAGFAEVLSGSSILICLLPLTPQTEGILNAAAFAELPRGAVVVNCARGGHLIDADLLSALDSGQLSAAVLDVFHSEPLPQEHPFWAHPKIHMTPHMASLTTPQSAVLFLAENIRRIERGVPALSRIDLGRGY